MDKEWKKLETNPAWQLDRVRGTKEVILEAQRDKKKVHFAALMAICHLKNAELKPKLQKCKGRVALRGDVVEDDSGAYAVFTEQGSSASQMSAAKETDVIARLPDSDGQAADAVSAYTQVKMEDASQVAQISKVRVSRDMSTSSTTQMAKILVRHLRSSGSSRTKFVRTPTCWSLVGKTVRGSFVGTRMWRREGRRGNSELGMYVRSSETSVTSVKEAEKGSHVEEIDEKR